MPQIVETEIGEPARFTASSHAVLQTPQRIGWARVGCRFGASVLGQMTRTNSRRPGFRERSPKC